MLAPVKYKERYDNIARVIYYHLNHKLGFTETNLPYYDTKYVKPVKENESATIYWDYPMVTNNMIQHNKPDVIVVFKKVSMIWIIEVGCPWDGNIDETIREKRRKYIPLSIELKDIFQKEKCSIFNIVIGATGCVHKSILENIRSITEDVKEANRMFDVCQKAAILGSTRIVRQVFQMKD